MIDLPLLFAFIAAATLLALTPGVDTAIVLSTAIAKGSRPALTASLGIGLGCLIWGVAVSIGLGATLQASETAYTVIKYLGALYLLWLGIGLLLRPRSASLISADLKFTQANQRAFFKGLTANLLNPKVGIFYLTFLPQFIPQGADVASYGLLLASIHVLLSMIWFGMLIVATLPLGQFLQKPATVKILDRLVGSLFVFFAVKLAS